MNFKWNADFNVIFAAPASGKSTMARKYDNVVDIVGSRYKFLDYIPGNEETKELECRQKNPDYPNNYLSAIVEAAKNKDNLLLLPLGKSVNDGLIQKLHKKGLRFAIAFMIDLQDVEKAMRERGNVDDWVKRILGGYEDNVKTASELATEVITIQKGQHLEDALVEYLKSQ